MLELPSIEHVRDPWSYAAFVTTALILLVVWALTTRAKRDADGKSGRTETTTLPELLTTVRALDKTIQSQEGRLQEQEKRLEAQNERIEKQDELIDTQQDRLTKQDALIESQNGRLVRVEDELGYHRRYSRWLVTLALPKPPFKTFEEYMAEDEGV